jgi:glutamate synthase domain-containing protein 2
MADEKTIRVSAAALASINLDGRELLCLNRARKAGKVDRYTPFGGVLKYHPEAQPLFDSLEAVPERVQDDLRLHMPERHLQTFQGWFYERRQRETTVFREVQEELVDEERVLDSLSPTDLTETYITTAEERQISDKPGQEGRDTQRYLEIFRVILGDPQLDLIRRHLEGESNLELITHEEIREGKTNTGVKIGTNCLPLLEI